MLLIQKQRLSILKKVKDFIWTFCIFNQLQHIQGMRLFVQTFIKEMCEQVFGSECIISRFNDDVYFKSLGDYYLQKEKSLAQEKRYVLQNLKSRCIDYGFNGELNIMACIQMEAQHDKELAMQKLELQRANAENITKSSEEEEDLPFLIKFLGDVAVGVAEGMTDPAFQMHIQQQREINRLKANQN